MFHVLSGFTWLVCLHYRRSRGFDLIRIKTPSNQAARLDGAALLQYADALRDGVTTRSYVVGFIIAVPSNNKAAFIEPSKKANSVFSELGATRVIECWGDDVSDGKRTDFRRAVHATPDETIAFSWIEWPDKAARDAAMGQMDTLMKTEPRFNSATSLMPFDGKRVVFGGFSPLVETVKQAD